MLRLQLLPVALATFTVVYATTSINDPFRALALQVHKKPELPICCLKPQQSHEPIEDEILLSFEEWKQQQGDIINRTADTDASDTPAPVHPNDVPAAPHIEEPQKPPPHFRVPLTDRFNYASSECSARVHLAHRGAKSTSAILSSKRDRYMLSPCSAQKQFIVVELCDDIRIDTIQLANFEFFSGIFKDFKLSVAKTDITAEGAFTDAGVFRAKNIRGVQSFHPPTSLQGFYRYIRIDFLSHYGNEFFCPVSLLRVYGLTHLEEWKWDTWEQESREKVEAPSPETTIKEEPTSVVDQESATEKITFTSASINDIPLFTELPPVIELGPVWPSIHSAVTSNTEQNDSVPTPPPPASASHKTTEPVPTPSNPAPSTNASSTLHQSNLSVSVSIAIPAIPPETTPIPLISTKAIPTPSTSSKAISSIGKAVSTTASTPSPSTPTPSPSTTPSSGIGSESIYRTIMNRLTALEANHTLYARYVEQQTSGVREVLRRMGEDVGRLESIVRSQEYLHQRTLKGWEQSQAQAMEEVSELLKRVEWLRGEVELEKRLGVAQLCLLLAVLVFMGLTRGSRGDAVIGRQRERKLSVREWGRRHLSWSGDWRFRGGKEEKKSDDANGIAVDHDGTKVQFPSKSLVDSVPVEPRAKVRAAVGTSPIVRSMSNDSRVHRPRSRTPSMRGRQHPHPHQHKHSHQHQQRPVRNQQYLPATPTRLRAPIPLQRSTSHTNAQTPAAHRSARKWARTAHLHEVRSVGGGQKTENENDRNQYEGRGHDNPFWDGPTEGGKKAKEMLSLFEGEGDTWVDTDTDLESDPDGAAEGWTQAQVPEVRRPATTGNQY